jgi:hypothetical protein
MTNNTEPGGQSQNWLDAGNQLVRIGFFGEPLGWAREPVHRL